MTTAVHWMLTGLVTNEFHCLCLNEDNSRHLVYTILVQFYWLVKHPLQTNHSTDTFQGSFIFST